MKRSISMKASTQRKENSSLDLWEIDHLLTDDETAKIVGVTPGTLQVWRSTGRYKLPFVKVGRNVRYVQSNLIDWIQEPTHLDVIKHEQNRQGEGRWRIPRPSQTN